MVDGNEFSMKNIMTKIYNYIWYVKFLYDSIYGHENESFELTLMTQVHPQIHVILMELFLNLNLTKKIRNDELVFLKGKRRRFPFLFYKNWIHERAFLFNYIWWKVLF